MISQTFVLASYRGPHTKLRKMRQGTHVCYFVRMQRSQNVFVNNRRVFNSIEYCVTQACVCQAIHPIICQYEPILHTYSGRPKICAQSDVSLMGFVLMISIDRRFHNSARVVQVVQLTSICNSNCLCFLLRFCKKGGTLSKGKQV